MQRILRNRWPPLKKSSHHAFSYNGDGYTAQVSQNGDFWNITFNGEYTYVVELSEELPYPQTIYQFLRVPLGGNDAEELPPEGELVTIAQEFLFNVYGLDGEHAEASVFVFEDKVCVQFVMSETEIFQVRIHTGDLLPREFSFSITWVPHSSAWRKQVQRESNLLFHRGTDFERLGL